MDGGDFDPSTTRIKSKKRVRNAFFFFMQDLKAQWIRDRKLAPNTTMAEMSGIAGPVWKELDADDKEYYQDLAKNYKAQHKGLPPEKYYTTVKKRDCMGIPLEQHVDTEKLKNERRKRDRAADKARFQSGRGVIEQTFCFISFQLLLQNETESDDTFKIIPLEVGVAQFSISKGVIRTYHKFIDPKGIPTGYRYDAIRHSEQVHRIPPSDFEHSYDNYPQLWEELMNIMNPDKLPLPPPIYTQGIECNVAEKCLAWIARKAGAQNCFERNLHEAEGLLVDLVAHGLELGSRDDKSSFTVMTIAMAGDFVTTSVYDYEVSKRCLYHQGHFDKKEPDGLVLPENDNATKFCSLAIAQRYCFAFAEKLCGLYDVEVTENHLPEMSDTVGYVAKPFSSVDSYTKRYTSFSASDSTSKHSWNRKGHGRGSLAAADSEGGRPGMRNSVRETQQKSVWSRDSRLSGNDVTSGKGVTYGNGITSGNVNTSGNITISGNDTTPGNIGTSRNGVTSGKGTTSGNISATGNAWRHNNLIGGIGRGRGRGRGRGLIADQKQPRQPKTVSSAPLQTQTVTQPTNFTTTVGVMPEARTRMEAWNDLPPRNSSVVAAEHVDMLNSRLSRTHVSPPGFYNVPRQPVASALPVTLGRGQGVYGMYQAGQLNAGASQLNAGPSSLNVGASHINMGAPLLITDASVFNTGAWQTSTGSSRRNVGMSVERWPFK